MTRNSRFSRFFSYRQQCFLLILALLVLVLLFFRFDLILFLTVK